MSWGNEFCWGTPEDDEALPHNVGEDGSFGLLARGMFHCALTHTNILTSLFHRFPSAAVRVARSGCKQDFDHPTLSCDTLRSLHFTLLKR